MPGPDGGQKVVICDLFCWITEFLMAFVIPDTWPVALTLNFSMFQSDTTDALSERDPSRGVARVCGEARWVLG